MSTNEENGLGPWRARDFADNRWHVEADVLKPTTDARGCTVRSHVVAEVFPSALGGAGAVAMRIADFLNSETPKTSEKGSADV